MAVLALTWIVLCLVRTSSIIRETESLLARLDAAGKQPELYVYGRRGVTYYKYAIVMLPVLGEGDTDSPAWSAEPISKARWTPT